MVKNLMDRINWELFDPSKVDARSVRLAKGACLVEFNSDDYVQYLRNVFAGDALICDSLEQWGFEERQHGQALARWVKMCDPSFDFDRSLARFKSLYSVNVEVDRSTRGSPALELVARCLVETGTSTYYSALADASSEPVFEQICRQISADEIRHYTLFYKNLRRYQAIEKLSLFARVKMAVSRGIEAQDEELSSAYAAGNYPDSALTPAELTAHSREFLALGYHLYRKKHLEMVIKLAVNAAGLPQHRFITEPISNLLALVFFIQRWKLRDAHLPAALPVGDGYSNFALS